MYKVGEYVVYKKDVCIIKEIRNNRETGANNYVLNPIDDESLVIQIPTDNKKNLLRDVITKEEAEHLIEKIPTIQCIENIEDKYIEKTYKELLTHGTYEDLIKIIKTTYIRNDKRIKNNKKKSEKDEVYFNLAEKYLYNELSIAFHKSFEETKQFIIDKVIEITKQ